VDLTRPRPLRTLEREIDARLSIRYAQNKAAGNEAQALQDFAQMKQGRVIDLTRAITLSAALISLKRRLPTAESLILVTAQAHGAVLWTQDGHFEGLPGVNCKNARTRESKRIAEPRA